MRSSVRLLAAILPLLSLLAGQAGAADLDEAEALFRAGKYDECAQVAAEQIAGLEGWGERWRVLKISSEMQRGKYAEAMDTLERALRRFPATTCFSISSLRDWICLSTASPESPHTLST